MDVVMTSSYMHIMNFGLFNPPFPSFPFPFLLDHPSSSQLVCLLLLCLFFPLVVTQ